MYASGYGGARIGSADRESEAEPAAAPETGDPDFNTLDPGARRNAAATEVGMYSVGPDRL